MTTSRRSFLKSALLLSATACASPSLLTSSSPQGKSLIGVQLYTVREAMQQDPVGTLHQLAALGYGSLEGASYGGNQLFYGMKPAAFAQVLREVGLIMPSNHYRLGQDLENGQPVAGTILHDWDRAVDDAAQLGVKYMVCAYLSETERGGLDNYRALAETLNKAGEQCRKAGIQLCYHNHDFEFVAQDSQLPYDLLLATDPALVKMELDLYWATKAGQDPVALFQKYPGRFPLWHVKDMDKTPARSFTEVGNGVIDFKRIFAQADKAGLQYFFVEQDQTPGPPLDSLKQSAAYIKRELV